MLVLIGAFLLSLVMSAGEMARVPEYAHPFGPVTGALMSQQTWKGVIWKVK